MGLELGDKSDSGLKLGAEGPTEFFLCDGNVAWFPANAVGWGWGDPFPNYAAWQEELGALGDGQGGSLS